MERKANVDENLLPVIKQFGADMWFLEMVRRGGYGFLSIVFLHTPL